MAFIGAGISAVKGIADIYLNKRKLNELRKLDTTELQDLVPINKRAIVSLKLLQAEHIIQLSEGANRPKLSIIERKIAGHMENNIESKRRELAAKKATQLDIAHTILSIQKLATETADEIDRIDKIAVSANANSEKTLIIIEQKMEMLQSSITNLDKTQKKQAKASRIVIEQKMEMIQSSIANLDESQKKQTKRNRIYISFCFLAIALLMYVVFTSLPL